MGYWVTDILEVVEESGLAKATMAVVRDGKAALRGSRVTARRSMVTRDCKYRRRGVQREDSVYSVDIMAMMCGSEVYAHGGNSETERSERVHFCSVTKQDGHCRATTHLRIRPAGPRLCGNRLPIGYISVAP